MRPQNPSSKFTAILIPWVDDDCSLQRLPSGRRAILCTPFLGSARTGVRALPKGYAFTLGALLANVLRQKCPKREDRYIPASTAKRLSAAHPPGNLSGFEFFVTV